MPSRMTPPPTNAADRFDSNGHKKTRVALVWSPTPYEPGIPEDPPDGFPTFNPDAKKFQFEMVKLEKHSAIDRLQKLISAEKYDFYVNICDAFEQHYCAGVEVAEFLYRKCPVPFVSPTPEFFLISKFQMKFIANFTGISTPKFCFIFNQEKDYEENRNYLLNVMEFPMIVKHHNSGGSDGMSENSVVWKEEDLKIRIAEMVRDYGGALIEEFIRGTEYTVLIQENPADENSPIIYRPYRCLIPGGDDGFKHVDLKFKSGRLECEMVEDESLAEKLRSATKKIFLACRAHTYARCDYRLCAETGKIHFLEINASPCLFLNERDHGMADNILADSGSKKIFMQNIIDCALKFHRKRRTALENLTSNRQPDFGYAKAKKFIGKNETAIDFTQISHVKLVNKCEFSRFCPEFYKFFMATSLPINENLRLWLYNCWHAREDLELVAFKRSSKNSNCHLDENLRLIAKRDIDRGDLFILDESR